MKPRSEPRIIGASTCGPSPISITSAKRAQKDIEAANRYGLEKFAAELLPVRDSLELAVQSADKADIRSLKQGQDATLQLLVKAWKRSAS